MTIFGVMFWSFISGLMLGMIDGIVLGSAWRWLFGG